jgi:acyl-coenzyme A thioesterase PaaI-like protein
LKLKFFWDEKKQEASAEYLPENHFSGQGNILHGGIQMGLLDEIMGWTSYFCFREMAVTSDLRIQFLSPAYIRGEKIKVVCQVISKKGDHVKMQASLSDHTGVTTTTAVGTYHILSSDRYQGLIDGPPRGKGSVSDSLPEELEWMEGPDQDMNWHQACEWVRLLTEAGGGWRMPSIQELTSFFSKNRPGSMATHPDLKTSGWWFWSGEKDSPLSAMGFDIIRGKADSGGRSLVSGGRVSAVRPRVRSLARDRVSSS